MHFVNASHISSLCLAEEHVRSSSRHIQYNLPGLLCEWNRNKNIPKAKSGLLGSETQNNNNNKKASEDNFYKDPRCTSRRRSEATYFLSISAGWWLLAYLLVAEGNDLKPGSAADAGVACAGRRDTAAPLPTLEG
ncbi:hypothetical protein E2320_005597 [Naja naja]|nr:hypothetical protein E2320_005597 [Naja naja]